MMGVILMVTMMMVITIMANAFVISRKLSVPVGLNAPCVRGSLFHFLKWQVGSSNLRLNLFTCIFSYDINLSISDNYRMLTGRRADLSLGPLALIIGGREDKTNASNAAIQNRLCTYMFHFPTLQSIFRIYRLRK